MTKFYSLLRNNKQTGPFSLEELLQQNLTFLDLVWVQGQSNGWSYPAEIEELKSYVGVPAPPEKQVPADDPLKQHEAYLPHFTSTVSSTPSHDHPKIFVSLPKPVNHGSSRVFVSLPQGRMELSPEPAPQNKIHEETVPEKPLFEEPVVKNEIKPSDPSGKVERKTNEPENDYSNWYYRQNQKKKKALKLRQGIIASVILVICGYVAYALLTGTTTYKQSTPPAVQKIAYEGQPEQVPGTEAPASNSTEEATDISERVIEEKKENAGKKELIKSEKTTADKALPIEEKTTEPVNEKINDPEGPSSTDQQTASKENPVGEETRSAPASKKNKLGETISGVFDRLKKKKDPEPVVEEEPKPARNENGSRTATRRGESETEKAEGPNLIDLIELKPGEKPENWMMGIIGMKLTLYNHSSETIKTATVEVRYYGEQKNLLEKKVIYFNNIGPKRTLTMPVPDHRMAIRAEYKVVAAAAKEEDYVKWD